MYKVKTQIKCGKKDAVKNLYASFRNSFLFVHGDLLYPSLVKNWGVLFSDKIRTALFGVQFVSPA